MRILLIGTILAGLYINVTAQEAVLNAGDYFGDLKARPIGPALMSGRISDVELHPKNTNVLLVGSAGGGVWKSQDGGVRFTSIFDNYCQPNGCYLDL